jgi:hypothetical protein
MPPDEATARALVEQGSLVQTVGGAGFAVAAVGLVTMAGLLVFGGGGDAAVALVPGPGGALLSFCARWP